MCLLLLHGGIIVDEDERPVILGVCVALRALVARTEITLLCLSMECPVLKSHYSNPPIHRIRATRSSARSPVRLAMASWFGVVILRPMSLEEDCSGGGRCRRGFDQACCRTGS